MKLAPVPKELRMRKADVESILRRGREELPLETCGLMIGRREEGVCVCYHILHTQNMERSPASFTIAPEELLRGYQHADEVGMELVGIYHSHPARPTPSQTDIGFMKWSAPVWLIVSSLDWEYAAYGLEEGRPVEVRISLR